jgi:tyrosine-protein kinase Etk/Wzc
MRTSTGLQTLGINSRNTPPIGLSEVLQGSAEVKDAILKSIELNLYVLPAGKTVINPIELLCTPQFETLLRDIGPDFDWIIVDSPPILALADARLLVPLCDAALLVVRAEQTPVNLVKDCIERVGRDNICGVLLNGARNIKSSHYYAAYYQRSSK